MIACSLIYGINYFTLKNAYRDGLDPMAAVSLRSSAALLVFFIFHRLFVREKVNRKDLLKLAMCGLFGVSLNQILFMAGVDRTSEVNAATLMVTTPVFVFLLAASLKEEKFGLRQIAGLIISFTGASFLIREGSGESFNISGSSLDGDLMIIGNACSYGLYLVIVRPLIAKYSIFTIVLWIFAFGSVINIPLGIPGIIETDFVAMTDRALFGLLYLIGGTTIVAYFLNAWAMKILLASQASVYIYLQPLIVALFAFFACSHSNSDLSSGMGIGWMQVLCMFLIFTGVHLVNTKGKW